MKQPAHKITMFTGVPKQGWYWVLVGIIFSLILHIISITELPNQGRNPLLPAPKSQTTFDEVKVNVVTKKKPDAEKLKQQKILEAPLEPTAAPKVPSRLGAQDHIAEKETKIDERLARPKAADPGQLGHDLKTQKAQPAATAKPQTMTMTPNKSADTDRKQPDIMFAPDGTVIVPGLDKMKPRNKYEALMPNAQELQNQVAAGYADHVDDEIATGDKIDMNTSNFRFIGYFTALRKAFEHVWVYPSEAVRRGLQGETHVEFTIEKDGKVSKIRVVESSGHKILDVAVVEAIRLASPFGPLPSGYGKDRLTVTGSFRYVLTNYAGG